MKTRIPNSKPVVLMLAAVACGMLCFYVLAQNSSIDAPASKLSTAAELLRENRPLEAKALLDEIPATDASHAAAQCYRALALYALNDKQGFWKAVDAENVRAALAKLPIREEVWMKEIDAFLIYGKFESLDRKIAAFRSAYPSSPRLGGVEEYRLANLVERGVKKARDAARNKDHQYETHLSVSSTNLHEFLRLASGVAARGYNVLSNRSLQEDVWTARLLLGQGDAALAEIPNADAAAREKFNVLRLELEMDLRRDEVDKNLQRLTEFMEAFPFPTNTARVDRIAAVLHFRKGRDLSLEADAAERRGDARLATERRAAAARFFEAQRVFQQRVTAHAPPAFAEDDLVELHEDILYSYFLQRNDAELTTSIEKTIAQSKPGALHWIVAKLYRGIQLASQRPPNGEEAARALDDVLALGFNGEHQNDRLLISAARWRMHILLRDRRLAEARELAERIRDSQCRRDYRTSFTSEYSGVFSFQ